MESFRIYPWKGLRTSVPQNSPTLFEMVADDAAIVHCVDAMNVDFRRTRNACTKSEGKTRYDNTAIGSASKCLGLYYLEDAGNEARWFFENGKVYRYDSSRDPQRVCDTASCGGTPVTFANTDMDLYSIIRVGSYMVFSDWGEHTPYCSDYNDATLSKLISADTEYQGKYLAYFGNRILMANITSGITVGDTSVIWCGANPTPASSCTFGSGDPPTNHLYKPDDDTITGIKLMGRNSCYLYGENSIDSIDYYANYSTPFGIRSVVQGQGAYNHHSIVNAGGRHYLFNKNYGFCMFDGSPNFPAGGRPISDPIENIITGINIDYAGWISGVFIPSRNEIAWTVPLYGSSTPDHILYYHILDNSWRIEDKVAYFLSTMPVSTDVTMQALINLGYTTAADFGTLRMADFISTYPKMIFGNSDGKLYYTGTESDDSSALDGYRTEPIIDFGRPNDKDLLLEIWFDLNDVGSYSMYCYYRGGDTVGETKAASWTALTEMSCDDPANAVFRLAETNRFHQIKWGTDGASEPFSVSSIEFRFVPQGRY